MNIKLAGLAALSPFALVLAIAIGAAGAGVLDPSPASALAGCWEPVTAGTVVNSVTLDADQVGNAQIIYAVGVQLGLPIRGEIIAIATAMQESSLHNSAVATDHDSLGLFQQRPSQGWGSPAQLTDPVYASRAFYNKLVKIAGWQTMPLTQAAQAVQRSAFPDAYATWEPLGTRLAATFSGAAAACSADNGIDIPGDSVTTLPPSYKIPAGTPLKAAIAVAWALRQLGTPYSWGGSCTAPHSGDPAKQCDCSSLVQQAYRHAGISLPRVTYDQVNVGTPVYDVKYLVAGDLIFIPGSDGTYEHPGHVGMYIGHGLIVNAPQTGELVKISRLAGYWQDHIAAVRRPVN
ncbi:C40 family peptidase [Hamadaea sp. NPDC051192]|uniref:C40 family peptidase n=1 Tax=Hamadaea sp. NPDC051192 TaxID=3154940 RepID=UPI003448D4C0